MDIKTSDMQNIINSMPQKINPQHNDHPLPRYAVSVFQLLKREGIITWALCRNNLPGCLACFVGGLIPRIIVTPVPLKTGAAILLRVVVISLIWDYIIDIANTSTSVKEDKLNKPHRPIPSGLISLRQSQRRWLLSWCILPIITNVQYGSMAAFYVVSWQLWVIIFYVWPAYRHWFSKSLMTAGATFMMLRLLNIILRDIELWQTSVHPDIAICLWTTATIHLQDFRDIEGDRTTHVVTIPLMLSVESQIKLRWLTSFLLVLCSATSAFWIWMREQSTSAFLTGAFFHFSSLVLAYYTFTSTSREEYFKMYRWWMITGFCVVVHIFDLYLLAGQRSFESANYPT